LWWCIGDGARALIAALLVGLVDTFGRCCCRRVRHAGYMLMAAVLLFKPEGCSKHEARHALVKPRHSARTALTALSR
jgi:branched-subunit amino acid ABC-type transport system permease component